MRESDKSDFREFVAARIPALRRSACLLCGDPYLADDLVSAALLKLYRRWGHVKHIEHADAYLRRIMINVMLDERRRPWRREHSVDRLPEPPPHAEAPVADRLALLGLLARLTPRRRAVLVLRFYEDQSVEQTAQAMGCTPGTVKRHTHRALADLRALLNTTDRDGTEMTLRETLA